LLGPQKALENLVQRRYLDGSILELEENPKVKETPHESVD